MVSFPQMKTLADSKRETVSLRWAPVYCNMVAILVKEYSDKGWGQVDEKAMEGIISKAKAIADLHSKVASATV